VDTSTRGNDLNAYGDRSAPRADQARMKYRS